MVEEGHGRGHSNTYTCAAMSGPRWGGKEKREGGKPISKDRSWFTGMNERFAKSGFERVVCGCEVRWPASMGDIGTRIYKGHRGRPGRGAQKVGLGSEKAGSGEDVWGRHITTLRRRTMKRSRQHGPTQHSSS